MNKSFYKKGIIAAGVSNIVGVLIFSRFFTNEWITKADPVAMSTLGLVMIIIWGVVYISVANGFEKVKWLFAVFAVQKLIYGLIWINWIFYNDIRILYKKDIMTGIFYSIYGLNDLIFMVFFTIVFFQVLDLDARLKKN